jgi:hypothetical protein
VIPAERLREPVAHTARPGEDEEIDRAPVLPLKRADDRAPRAGFSSVPRALRLHDRDPAHRMRVVFQEPYAVCEERAHVLEREARVRRLDGAVEVRATKGGREHRARRLEVLTEEHEGDFVVARRGHGEKHQARGVPAL